MSAKNANSAGTDPPQQPITIKGAVNVPNAHLIKIFAGTYRNLAKRTTVNVQAVQQRSALMASIVILMTALVLSAQPSCAGTIPGLNMSTVNALLANYLSAGMAPNPTKMTVVAPLVLRSFAGIVSNQHKQPVANAMIVRERNVGTKVYVRCLIAHAPLNLSSAHQHLALITQLVTQTPASALQSISAAPVSLVELATNLIKTLVSVSQKISKPTRNSAH